MLVEMDLVSPFHAGQFSSSSSFSWPWWFELPLHFWSQWYTPKMETQTSAARVVKALQNVIHVSQRRWTSSS